MFTIMVPFIMVLLFHPFHPDFDCVLILTEFQQRKQITLFFASLSMPSLFILYVVTVYGSLGVISAPEVKGWQSLTANDSYIVAASDGVFENQSPQDVCDILWIAQSHVIARSELPSSCSFSLADCIVDATFEKGSMDNMAVVVVPVQSVHFLQDRKRSLDGPTDLPTIREKPGVSFCCFHFTLILFL